MGTVVEITVADSNRARAKKAIEKAFGEIKRIDKFAGPVEGDEIKLLNMNAEKAPFPASKELFSIIGKSVRYSHLTGGAFDISVTPVLDLWGFLGPPSEFSIPEPTRLQSALKLVNYQNILLDPYNISIFLKKKRMKLTLGGIAKGYAVGRAISVLKKQGVNHAIVNAGGDIQIIGHKYGKPWRIGIRHPRNRDEILTTIYSKGNKCIFTSGDYERYFMVDNKRYHHIINPATGFPSNSACISVSIVCNDPIEADALATAVFVLGPEKGMELVESMPQVEVLIVYRKNNKTTIKRSKGFMGE
jgi:thiamine biosynthesis lipoprotein